MVEWKVENENNMLQYEVQTSADGATFVKEQTIIAKTRGTDVYDWTDENAAPGNHYYRIKSVDRNGRATYSPVVKVRINESESSINVYPNPVKDNIIHLHLIHQPEGTYFVRLLNAAGQVVLSKEIHHEAGNSTENIVPDYRPAHGAYHLEVTTPGGQRTVVKLFF